MSRRINEHVLRDLAWRYGADRIEPIVATLCDKIRDERVIFGPVKLPPLTQAEASRPLGSLNVRAIIDWLHDFDEEYEPILAALARTLGERMPTLFAKYGVAVDEPRGPADDPPADEDATSTFAPSPLDDPAAPKVESFADESQPATPPAPETPE